jgi:hypothetical protein
MRKLASLMMGLLLLALIAPTFAQDMAPMVMVQDQVVLDSMIKIDHVYSAGPGFVVIHIQQDGSVGPVAGYRWVNQGDSINVWVPVDASMLTPTVYAMLHEDTGEVGVYEFGTVEGADSPVSGDMAAVNPPIKIDSIRAYDQFVTDNTVTIASVTAQVDGWLVIHEGTQTEFGPVLGQTAVPAGTTTDVVVELTGEATPFLWPMLHVDTGEVGTYEFGTVEGADGPVVVGGAVAALPIVVGAPSMRVNSQLVTDTVWATSVLSQGPGFLVIHADNEGAPGEVIGFAPVADGVNLNVAVEVDPAKVTPVVFPMLHADTGAVGTYEFGEVEGEDLPQSGSNGSALFFPILAKPGIIYSGTLDGDVLTVAEALIDTQGFLVIHADNAGAPGPVLGFAPLVPGLSRNIAVNIPDATDTVFPMLHVDTGALGTYEFGEVEGEDLPVRVNDTPVFGPLTPGS